MNNSKYISPAEVWKSLEDLRPFSEYEEAQINRVLSNKQYYTPQLDFTCSDAESIEKEDLEELILYLQNAYDKKRVVHLIKDWDNEVGADYLYLYTAVNEEEFSRYEAEKLRSGIINGRKIAEATKRKTEIKLEIEAKIRDLTRKFSQDEIPFEDFTKAISDAQFELKRLQ